MRVQCTSLARFSAHPWQISVGSVHIPGKVDVLRCVSTDSWVTRNMRMERATSPCVHKEWELRGLKLCMSSCLCRCEWIKRALLVWQKMQSEAMCTRKMSTSKISKTHTFGTYMQRSEPARHAVVVVSLHAPDSRSAKQRLSAGAMQLPYPPLTLPHLPRANFARPQPNDGRRGIRLWVCSLVILTCACVDDIRVYM